MTSIVEVDEGDGDKGGDSFAAILEKAIQEALADTMPEPAYLRDWVVALEYYTAEGAAHRYSHLCPVWRAFGLLAPVIEGIKYDIRSSLGPADLEDDD